MNKNEKENKDKIAETEYHSLFVENIPEHFEKVEVDFVQDNENNTKDSKDSEIQFPEVYEKISEENRYILYLGEFSASSGENNKILHMLRQADPADVLEIHVSSPGGNFYEILEFYNTITPKFYRTVSFLNIGHSAGSIAFLLADERIVYENSDFMVHSYAGGSWGKRNDMLNQVHHVDKMITTFFSKIYSPYFSKKELKKINEGKDFWMDSIEMLKRGIATHIITDEGEYMSADAFLNIKFPGWIEKQNKIKSEVKKELKINLKKQHIIEKELDEIISAGISNE